MLQGNVRQRGWNLEDHRMGARRLVFNVMLLMLALTAWEACADPEQCAGGLGCNKGGLVQTCCTSTNCKYKASDGTVFDCGGTNCSVGNPSAAELAAKWCNTH
jgi:hypothetical protein